MQPDLTEAAVIRFLVPVAEVDAPYPSARLMLLLIYPATVILVVKIHT